ncbi:MAG TPA: sugar phosphate isomerase/epimerase family protein, partial [bacterium]|nr:sugar phosphate isomerase/epimerase family protein [bacterium]
MENRIGVVSCHLMSLLPFEETMTRLAHYGIGEIEWFVATDYQARYGQDIFENIRRNQEKVGVVSSYHAPYLGEWNLGLVRSEEARERVREIIDYCSRLGATSITLHAGSCRSGEKSSRSQALCQVAEVLETFIPELEKRNLTVCLENNTICYDLFALGSQLEDFFFLFERLPASAVGLNLDTGHSHIMGMTEGLLTHFSSRLWHTHLHDNDRLSDSHLAPGEGSFDWSDFFWRLKEIKYSGPLVLEFPEKTGQYENFIS